jgi:hypothetical protein
VEKVRPMKWLMIVCVFVIFSSCSRRAEKYDNEELVLNDIKQCIDEVENAHDLEELSVQDIINQNLPALDTVEYSSTSSAQIITTQKIGKNITLDAFVMTEMTRRHFFEIVGWSNTGAVAFLKEEGNIHTWNTNRELVIFDTARDEVIERFGIGFHHDNDEDGNFIAILPSEENITAVLQEWNEILSRHGINERIHYFNDMLNVSQVASFPIIGDKTIYDCWFEATIEEHIGENQLTNKVTVEWNLVISDGVQKRILSSGEEAMPWIGRGYVASRVAGFHESPYGNNILIIAEHFSMGIGLSIHYRIDFHGFCLETGFN